MACNSHRDIQQALPLSRISHLVDEFPVDTPDGVSSVPIQLLWARRLLPHALQIVGTLQTTHALQIVATLQVAHALQVVATWPQALPHAHGL